MARLFGIARLIVCLAWPACGFDSDSDQSGTCATGMCAASSTMSLIQKPVKVATKVTVIEKSTPADASGGSGFSKRDVSRYEGLSDSEVSTLERMIYAFPHELGPSLDAPNRYLLFDYDLGGLNNIRIGWEMAGLIAQRTNRTLVLPPACKFYLIPDHGDSQASDFIELARLKATLPALTFDEFVERETSNIQFPDFVLDDTDRPRLGSGNGPGSKWQEWASKNTEIAVVSGSKHCELESYISDAKVLYAATTDETDRTFGCGDWAAMGQPTFTEKGKAWEVPNEAWKLLRNGFVWHPDAFRVTAKIVNKLGLFQYVSMHARYNDFQFKDKRLPVEEVIEAIEELGAGNASSESAEGLLAVSARASAKKTHGHHAIMTMIPFLKHAKTLYISTDETDPAFFEAFKAHGIDAVRWEDFEDDIKDVVSPDRMAAIKGVVEQMVIAYGKIFVGTALSTFSAYAQRMRIYADAPVKERLYHTTPRTNAQNKRIEDELEAWEARGGVSSFDPDDIKLASLHFPPGSDSDHI